MGFYVLTATYMVIVQVYGETVTHVEICVNESNAPVHSRCSALVVTSDCCQLICS